MEIDISKITPMDIEWEFAGATMGSVMVMECGICGSLVRQTTIEGHETWHGYVAALAEAIKTEPVAVDGPVVEPMGDSPLVPLPQ